MVKRCRIKIVEFKIILKLNPLVPLETLCNVISEKNEDNDGKIEESIIDSISHVHVGESSEQRVMTI